MVQRTWQRWFGAVLAVSVLGPSPSCGGDSPQKTGAVEPAADGGAAEPAEVADAGSAAVGGSRAPGTAGKRADPTPTPAAGSGGRTAPAADGGAGAGAGGSTSRTPSTGCTRDLLHSTIEAYYLALAAHDASQLPLAMPLKFTENGMTLQPGEGLWKTANAAKLKRGALDTETCSSVTESVVTEGSTDIVVGLRLKLVDQKITEIESIVVRKGDYSSNPMTLLGTASDDWETVLPADQRATRATLMQFVERYFTNFPAGGCMFASDCKRYENGFTPGNCSLGLSCSETMSRTGMKNRLSVLDVEAGIAVGFTMFQGQYTDFHMFKVRNGEVHGVHAVLAKASSSGW